MTGERADDESFQWSSTEGIEPARSEELRKTQSEHESMIMAQHSPR